MVKRIQIDDPAVEAQPEVTPRSDPMKETLPAAAPLKRVERIRPESSSDAETYAKPRNSLPRDDEPALDTRQTPMIESTPAPSPPEPNQAPQTSSRMAHDVRNDPPALKSPKPINCVPADRFGEYSDWSRKGGPTPPADGAYTCKVFWHGYTGVGTSYLNSDPVTHAFRAGQERAKVEPGLSPGSRKAREL